MVHMSKMIVPPGIFLIFQNFGFLGRQVGERTKMAQNDKTFCPALYFRNHISYDFW